MFTFFYNSPSHSALDLRQRQNLRTVIVTADIHQGLYQSAKHIATSHRRYLTFWHWSGVTPYTSSCEFAGSCVFGKQLPEILSLRPDVVLRLIGKALSRSYGCFFAEFLGDHSLVRLGLIDLITCVGLRYGFYIHKFRDFSWKRALYHYPPAEAGKLSASLSCAI